MNWLNGYECVADTKNRHIQTKSESKIYTVHANTNNNKARREKKRLRIILLSVYKKKHVQFGVHFDSPPKWLEWNEKCRKKARIPWTSSSTQNSFSCLFFARDFSNDANRITGVRQCNNTHTNTIILLFHFRFCWCYFGMLVVCIIEMNNTKPATHIFIYLFIYWFMTVGNV